MTIEVVGGLRRAALSVALSATMLFGAGARAATDDEIVTVEEMRRDHTTLMGRVTGHIAVGSLIAIAGAGSAIGGYIVGWTGLGLALGTVGLGAAAYGLKTAGAGMDEAKIAAKINEMINQVSIAGRTYTRAEYNNVLRTAVSNAPALLRDAGIGGPGGGVAR